MNRHNYVCLEHRVAHRYGLPWSCWASMAVGVGGGSRHCPVDGAPLIDIGYRWRIPRKNDDRGWRKLAEFVRNMYPWKRDWKFEYAQKKLRDWR